MTRDADEVFNRPKDVSFAIDQVTRWNKTHSKLSGKCDAPRVGVMGHSFGAYTTLAVCGARPALDWLEPKVGAGKGLGLICQTSGYCGVWRYHRKAPENRSSSRRATGRSECRSW